MVVLGFFGVFMVAPLGAVMFALMIQGPIIYFQNLAASPTYWRPNVEILSFTISMLAFILTLVKSPRKIRKPMRFVSIGLLGISFFFLFRSWPILNTMVRVTSGRTEVTGIDQGVLLNTVYVALATTVLSGILGVALGYIMARYRFKGKTIFRVLLFAPMAAPPLVGAIGLRKMIGSGQNPGTLNLLLWKEWGILPSPVIFEGLAAVVAVQVLHYFVFPYLYSFASFLNIDPSSEEAAENLGASRIRTFLTVTLPMATPGIVAGLMMTFILSIEDLGTPVVFIGDDQAKSLLTMKIYLEVQHAIQGARDVGGFAIALSAVLILMSLLGYVVIKRVGAAREYATLRVAEPRVFIPPKPLLAGFYVLLGVVTLLGILPHIGVVLLSIADVWPTLSPFPQSFTLQNFVQVYTNPFWGASTSTVNSLTYSLLALVIIVLLGLSAGYLIQRTKIRGKELLELIVTIPIAVPGVVLAVGLFTIFIRIPPQLGLINMIFNPLVSPAGLLVASYAVRRFPFTVRSVIAGLQQTRPEMEEASHNLGAGPLRTVVKITIPMILISLLSGAALSFVNSMSEVSTSILLTSEKADFPITKSIESLLPNYAYAAALGDLLIVLQVVAIAVSTLAQKRQRGTVVVGL